MSNKSTTEYCRDISVKQQLNVPELRFLEFEGAWEKKTIGDYYNNLRTGMTPYRGKKEYYNGDIPWITSGELNFNLISNTRENITQQAVIETNLKIYPPYTFFIAITGLEAPGTRGKCALNFVPATTNQSCMAFEEISQVSTMFLYYWYQKFGIALYYHFAQGTKQQSFNNKIVEKFEFIHPIKEEQQKIASFLTAVDQRIQLLQKKKAKLEEYKKGVMQKLFSREIRFKDENGNDFPDWEEKRLGEVAQFSKGKGISKSDIVNNGDLECIRYGELYTEYKDTINEIKSRTVFRISGFVLSEANDVVIPASGETKIDIAKASCVLRSGIALGGDINIIKTSMNGVFLAYYLNNARKKEIAGLAQGISVVHLYASQLKTLTVYLPQLQEQQKIVSFLTNLDQKVEQVKIQIEKMQIWKKGLLQKMFV